MFIPPSIKKLLIGTNERGPSVNKDPYRLYGINVPSSCSLTLVHPVPNIRLETCVLGECGKAEIEENLSPVYCKLGDFSVLKVSCQTNTSYPIVAVKGNDFCDVSVILRKNFDCRVRDDETGTISRELRMEDTPVFGFFGDTFDLRFLWDSSSCLVINAHAISGSLQFTLDNIEIGVLPAGGAIRVYSRLVEYKKDLQAALRNLKKEVTDGKLKRISA